MRQFTELNSSAIRSIRIEGSKVLLQYQSNEKEYEYTTSNSVAFVNLLDQESNKSEPSFGRLINRSIKNGTLELIEV